MATQHLFKGEPKDKKNWALFKKFRSCREMYKVLFSIKSNYSGIYPMRKGKFSSQYPYILYVKK